jgi:hypothetical protein
VERGNFCATGDIDWGMVAEPEVDSRFIELYFRNGVEDIFIGTKIS